MGDSVLVMTALAAATGPGDDFDRPSSSRGTREPFGANSSASLKRRARRHSPHLGMPVKSIRLSNWSCGLPTSWKSDQNQSKVSEAGALEGVRFPLRTCVITIRLRGLRRCLCSLHDLSLLFSRSGRSIVASQPHTHTTTIPSHPLNERTHAMRP